MSPEFSTPRAHAEPDRRGRVRTDATRVVILGSTGSIGTQTIEAIAHLNRLHGQGRFPRRFEVVGLAAGRDAAGLREQARALGVGSCALAEGSLDIDGAVFTGEGAAERLVRETPCDLVVGGIVGIAGLHSMTAALEAGTDVALANKETLVAAGSLVMPLAARTGARLLPVDSEHAGVWQCLMQATGTNYAPPAPAPDDIAKVVLTASGGAFRGQRFEDVADATPERALAHPTWDMGAKVTIDTATLVNKALELVEAHWLFGLGAERLDAVIHPGSTVHAMVQMGDGSVISQLGAPDMRTPIMRALAFPERSPEPMAPMDPAGLGTLEFRPIEGAWRRGIELGMWAIRSGGTAGAAFNAANEAAVRAFLAGTMPFGSILDVVERVCEAHPVTQIASLGDVLEADRSARAHAETLIGRGR